MQITSAVFYKHLHLWKHEEIEPEQKLRMFEHLIAKLVYAGAVTWKLDSNRSRPSRTSRQNARSSQEQGVYFRKLPKNRDEYLLRDSSSSCDQQAASRRASCSTAATWARCWCARAP